MPSHPTLMLQSYSSSRILTHLSPSLTKSETNRRPKLNDSSFLFSFFCDEVERFNKMVVFERRTSKMSNTVYSNMWPKQLHTLNFSPSNLTITRLNKSTTLRNKENGIQTNKLTMPS